MSLCTLISSGAKRKMTAGINPVLWLRPEDMALIVVSATTGACFESIEGLEGFEPSTRGLVVHRSTRLVWSACGLATSVELQARSKGQQLRLVNVICWSFPSLPSELLQRWSVSLRDAAALESAVLLSPSTSNADPPS